MPTIRIEYTDDDVAVYEEVRYAVNVHGTAINTWTSHYVPHPSPTRQGPMGRREVKRDFLIHPFANIKRISIEEDDTA